MCERESVKLVAQEDLHACTSSNSNEIVSFAHAEWAAEKSSNCSLWQRTMNFCLHPEIQVSQVSHELAAVEGCELGELFRKEVAHLHGVFHAVIFP
jgi:hypothetical protein